MRERMRQSGKPCPDRVVVFSYFLSLVIRCTLKQAKTELLLLCHLDSRGHSNSVYRSMKQAIICSIVRSQKCAQLQVPTSHEVN